MGPGSERPDTRLIFSTVRSVPEQGLPGTIHVTHRHGELWAVGGSYGALPPSGASGWGRAYLGGNLARMSRTALGTTSSASSGFSRPVRAPAAAPCQIIWLVLKSTISMTMVPSR